jgi:Holliday junction DNA helicase RuvA
MIGYLHGTVVDVDNDYVILNVGGVGYRVTLPANLMNPSPAIGTELQLHVELELREDSVTLYGFRGKEDLKLYQKLRSVSGIGPKVAIGIIGTAEQSRFIRSILNEEINYLTKLPGVGKKTAQRLILELKDKVSLPEYQLDSKVPDGPSSPVLDDALQALLSLGYLKPEVLPLLVKGQELLGSQCDAQDLIRFVLKAAGKNRRR